VNSIISKYYVFQFLGIIQIPRPNTR